MFTISFSTSGKYVHTFYVLVIDERPSIPKLPARPPHGFDFKGVSLQSPRNSHISLGLQSGWLTYRSSYQAGIR